jgi:outer membrane protein insertion porin family
MHGSYPHSARETPAGNPPDRIRSVAWVVLLLLISLFPSASLGQAARFPVNTGTVLRGVDFRFETTRTFSQALLFEQIASKDPSFGDKLRRWLPLLSEDEQILVPEEVQRDVVRLRAFYAQNGFPDARVSYSESRFDAPANHFWLRFTIDEGEPIRVVSIDVAQRGGRSVAQGTALGQALRGVLTLSVGDRFSQIEHARSQEQLAIWHRNRGRPFVRVRDSVHFDVQNRRAEITYWIEEGPEAFLDTIVVEGNARVARRLIARELNMKPGDRFSQRRLTAAQRELFNKNLFRTVLVDVPAQPLDSTVTVRMRVREGRPRLVSYRSGYGRLEGWSVQGDWTHRNFLGDTRVVTVGAVARTGQWAYTTDRVAPRLYRASVNLRHPRFLYRRLSLTGQVFAQYRRDPELPESDRLQGINEQEAGIESAVIYEFLPRRTLTVQYNWSRTLQYSGATGFTRSKDAFNRGSLALVGLLGRTGSILRYQHSVLVIPVLEFASPGLGSDIDYLRATLGIKVSRRMSRRSGLAFRTSIGRLWPRGTSANQEDPTVENRFDRERFYLGGSSDLRGWTSGLAGPKVVRPSVSGADTTFVYEAVGGLAKLAMDVELRLPFPGLGASWGTALFVGGGQLSDGPLFEGGFRFGAGGGIRYATPVGMVALDLAWKINPDEADLRRAEWYDALGADAAVSWTRRWSLHLSIGQIF